MAFTTLEAREQILDDLAAATGRIELASICLTEAYERLDVGTADRLEDELYRPLQRALGRAKRTHSGFAERVGLAGRERGPEPEPPSLRRESVRAIIERAVAAGAEAGRRIGELQDSMLPIEAGDAELRAGLAEVRELLVVLSDRAPRFLRTLGR